MEQLIFFHDHTMVVLVIVTILVGYVLFRSMLMMRFDRNLFEGQELERVWTVLPAVFLLVIALPSLRLLYLMEEMDDPDLTIRSTGRQWYWVYEYADLDVRVFDSYILPVNEETNFRLIEVDNSLSLPVGAGVRVIISSGDVIHSWTVPALGVKADGIPGRLNQVMFVCSRPGVYIGQCSEICGANHRFMPIVIMMSSRADFLAYWV